MLFSIYLLLPVVGLALLLFPGISAALFILSLPVESVHIFLQTGEYVSKFPVYLVFLPLMAGSMFLRKVRQGAKSAIYPLLRVPAALGILGLLALAFQAASVIWAPDFKFAVASVIHFALNLSIFFLILAMVGDTNALDRLFGLIVLSGIVTATFVYVAIAYDFAEKVSWTQTAGYAYGLLVIDDRVSGLGGADQTAGFLAAATLLAMAKFSIAPTRRMKWCYAGSIIYMLLAMLVTLSRGAMVGFVAGAVCFIFLHPACRLRPLACIAILLVGLSCLALLAKPGFIDRMLVGFGYTGELLFSEKQGPTGKKEELASTGMTARIEWWKSGLSAMLDRPYKLISGLGAGGFIHFAQAPEVHSVYLAYFFDIGIAGVLLCIFSFYLLLALFYESFQMVTPNSKLHILLIACSSLVFGEVLVHGLVEYELCSMIGRYPLFYLSLGVASVKLAQRQKSDCMTAGFFKRLNPFAGPRK